MASHEARVEQKQVELGHVLQLKVDGIWYRMRSHTVFHDDFSALYVLEGHEDVKVSGAAPVEGEHCRFGRPEELGPE